MCASWLEEINSMTFIESKETEDEVDDEEGNYADTESGYLPPIIP